VPDFDAYRRNLGSVKAAYAEYDAARDRVNMKRS